MNPTNKSWTAKRYPSYGRLGHEVDLGIAILIAEDAAGQYELLGPVSTVNEAIEMANDHYNRRVDELDRDQDVLRVETYRVWARNDEGEYAVVYEARWPA